MRCLLVLAGQHGSRSVLSCFNPAASQHDAAAGRLQLPGIEAGQRARA